MIFVCGKGNSLDSRTPCSVEYGRLQAESVGGYFGLGFTSIFTGFLKSI